jgi:flagellar hook assembly protein FlgD
LLQSDLFVNLAIFAVVAESPNSIEEQGYMNGVKVTMYPNPAVSSENVTIQYGLETSAKNVDLSIVNVNGQVVYTAAQGAKASGIYTMNVPAGTLSSGSYIYVLNADGARIAKRMEILK